MPQLRESCNYTGFKNTHKSQATKYLLSIFNPSTNQKYQQWLLKKRQKVNIKARINTIKEFNVFWQKALFTRKL